MTAREAVAYRYWEVSRAVHNRPSCPVSVKDQVEFLKRMTAQEGWTTLRLRAGSLLASKFPNLCCL